MEEYIRMEETRLSIGGTGRAYKILHISDSHIGVADELSTEKEREAAEKSAAQWASNRQYFAKHFGEPYYPCHEISPIESFEKVLDFCQAESPDLLVLTGDILDYMCPAGVRYLEKRLAALPFPWLYVPGNHETGSVSNAALSGVVGDGDVQVRDFGAFRVIGVDDGEKTVSDKQLAQLKALLVEPTPAIVAMHIPVGTAENREYMRQYEDYYVLADTTEDANGGAFVKLLAESDAVKLVLCGHVHGMGVSHIAADKVQFCASSSLVGFVHRIIVE